MANVRNANTYYIDSDASELAVKNIRLVYLIVAVTATSANLVLKDVSSGAIKIDIRLSVSETEVTQQFSFEENPILFPNGINPDTVSNCTATCVIEESRG